MSAGYACTGCTAWFGEGVEPEDGRCPFCGALVLRVAQEKPKSVMRLWTGNWGVTE